MATEGALPTTAPMPQINSWQDVLGFGFHQLDKYLTHELMPIDDDDTPPTITPTPQAPAGIVLPNWAPWAAAGAAGLVALVVILK